MASSMIGSKVERTEDKKFITGKGRYTADITLHGQSYAFFIRSPHARAKIKKVDIAKALKAPGVVSILTGEDIVKDKIGGLNCWMENCKQRRNGYEVTSASSVSS